MKLLFESWRQYLSESRENFATNLLDKLKSVQPADDDMEFQDWRGRIISTLQVYQRMLRKRPERAEDYLENSLEDINNGLEKHKDKLRYEITV
tara:strand:- start:698 stop:976 length:279 start_codon:yes stop_codon:yes gene_type:complete